MKYIFIINPMAGQGKAEEDVRAALETLEEKELCELYITKHEGDAMMYITDYCKAHPEEEIRFIACGGDGTLNEVCNGAAGKENVSVTCYPSGSGNDFIKIYGGAEKFSDIGKLLKAPVRKIDLLRMKDRYADNVINFGFDTTVAITINEERAKTGKGNKNAYTKGVVRALMTAMKNRFTVIADGEVLNPDGKGLLCTIANGQYVGGSFRCAPKSEPDDGWIDVCLIRPISRIRFVQILDTYTNGKHLDDPKMQDIIIYRRAKSVEVKGPAGFACSLDGEIIYDRHFTVEIAPGILNFAVPE